MRLLSKLILVFFLSCPTLSGAPRDLRHGLPAAGASPHGPLYGRPGAGRLHEEVFLYVGNVVLVFFFLFVMDPATPPSVTHPALPFQLCPKPHRPDPLFFFEQWLQLLIKQKEEEDAKRAERRKGRKKKKVR